MLHKTRSSAFWITFASLSLLSALAAFYLFPLAFPIITLNVTMDRSKAIKAAHAIAQQFELGPEGAQYSASFVSDDLAKTFVELECGGATRFMEIIRQQLYHPYTWQVRNFKPYNPHELLIKYTPDGTAYGFIETLSEELQGASLQTPQAQAIAEQAALTQWKVDLSDYTLAESSQETVTSGRIDHTFVYERTDQTIGEGFYRLTITVSGDKVTQLNHSIKVPDNFIRRYQQMRTANDTIARVAQLLILLLYFLGGMIGLIFFMRRRLVIWRPAITAGLFIAILQFCLKINELPLLWMHYQTSLAPASFVLQILTYGIYQLVYTALLYTIIFAIAETFTRNTLGSHPQFWQLWTTQCASSTNVIRATLTGYLAVPFFMLFVILFYIVANHQFCWWIPSQAFFEPNILATYLPWLSSLSQALSAGFMEECLFRAIPIAGALLLSARYGHQTIFLIVSFILQALIFGAAHANYPMQPAYARLVELLIPSCGFGALYYFAGLFPAVIAHVIYDVVWMALPIFMSHAPSAFLHKLIVIIISLLPVWILLYARIKAGRVTELPVTTHNEYWRPHAKIHQESETSITLQTISFPRSTFSGIFITALIAIIAWMWGTRFTADVPAMQINRGQAIEIAKNYFTHHNINIATPWKLLSHIADEDSSNVQHAFVWQTGGKSIYHQLQNSYLSKPHWIVRAAHFEGDIAARAEEYHVHIDDTGTIVRVRHQLPEKVARTSLSQTHARNHAHTAIKTQYGIDASILTEISAHEEKRPARKDWIFTFADQQNYPLHVGQARIAVEIAGDEIVDIYRYIFVPQEWRRSYENLSVVSNIIKQLCGLCIYLIFITATLGSLWQLTHNPTHHTFPLLLLLILLAFFMMSVVNGLPKITFMFNTCKPWNNQFVIMCVAWCISALVKAATLTGTCSIVYTAHTYYRIINTQLLRILLGGSIGIIFAGYSALAKRLIPSTLPLWPTYAYLNSYIPGYEFIVTQLISYLSFTLLVILVILLARHMMRLNRHSVVLSTLFLSTCGIMFAGIYYAHNIPLLLAIGIGFSVLLLALFHRVLIFDYTLIPLATASYTIVELLQESILTTSTHSNLYAYVTITLISACGMSWYSLLNRRISHHIKGY